ncbi:hypothetical protein PHISCL_03691 [Aspergillus sclerotialis]|uniref:ORC6 first cyclin-like domain-containing protein n=1 Tax=Aspergillus sclerotialis TaxID=2070753 RepID=A0A3A3A1G3_9EURO|nr:hypothetical protein PHISCL_03691 [Aspergillus sclerotialis]
MNNRPVEQALATLLPTHANDLPQELLSLSLSLVAQSRSFSTHLKPEEEIARPYACAEIACRRLSRALKLPPLLGNPPCPPKAYKNLYGFLERSLSTSIAGPKRSGSTSVTGTPTRSGNSQTTPSKRTPVSANTTPSKQPAATPTPHRPKPTPTRQATPLKRALSTEAPTLESRRKSPKLRPNGLSSNSSIPDAPGWVMNSIRTLCKTLSTPAPRTNSFSRPPISKTLPPHIFAGVSSILYFIGTSFENAAEELDEETLEFLEPVLWTKDPENDEDFKEIVYALIVAVYFLVLARRRNPNSLDKEGEEGEEGGNSAAQTSESRKMDKKTFSEMRQTALVSLGLSSAERRHRDDVDQWIALIMEEGWANGNEWFENIPQAGDVDGDEAFLSGQGEEEDDGGVSAKRTYKDVSALAKEDDSRGGLLPGLGTMMQDRVDWLSEHRREDYLDWKAEIMERVEMMEKAGA